MFSVEELKKDIQELEPHDFFEKYYCDDEIWYIQNCLGYDENEAKSATVKFRRIIAERLGINEDRVFMSGSGKIGCSLSPPRDGEQSKLFKPFEVDGVNRQQSDLDIVIISNELFDEFWRLYRTSYQNQYLYTYNYIIRETYRGFINEKNVIAISGCGARWSTLMTPVKATLQRQLGIRHEMNIRIYRTIEDFEDYSTSNLWKLKGKVV